MGMTFKKQIFPLGKHFVSDSKGNRREIEITEDRALAWINKFNNIQGENITGEDISFKVTAQFNGF